MRTLLALLLLLFPALAHARTWHILNDGSGDAPTVQAGIDSAAEGDTVLVGPGTYTANLVIMGKNLALASEFGPEITILDGSSALGSVVYLSGQTRSMVIEGFTITGGVGHFRGTVSDGGGVHLANFASPIIRRNRIAMNGIPGTTFFGGGIGAWTEPASPLIEDNLFTGNEARLGGAISLASGSPEIRRNIFDDNRSVTDGGGVYAQSSSGLILIEGNQFWNNAAGDHGGGIVLAGREGTEVRVVRNLFVSNRADGRDTGSGGGCWIIGSSGGLVANNTFVKCIGLSESTCGGGAIALDSTSPGLEISSNIFAFNRSCGISCRFDTQNQLGTNLFWQNEDGDLASGPGLCPPEWSINQIFADPLFCNPEAGNYTVSVDSPALTGTVPMGVWTTPGCGPGVPVSPTTWGQLKARYR